MMTISLSKLALAASFALLAGSASAATFSVTGGDGAIVAAPVSGDDFGNAAPTSIDDISAFLEFSGILTADLSMDVGGTVLSGGLVNSYMFYYNRDTSTSAPPVDSIMASFSFVGDILGFIVDEPKLNASDDIVGIPGVDYEEFTARGLETGAGGVIAPGSTLSNDYIASAVGSNDMDVFLRITQPGDWFRVITTQVDPSISEVPLPAGAPLLLAGLGGLAFLRRRRDQS